MPISSKTSPVSRLQPGDLAPEFTTVDTFGNPISLHDFAGEHLLLIFMRYSACPWCNLSVHRLTLEYPMITKQDCEVVVFMQSTAPKIVKNIYHKHKIRPPYPIVPDHRQLYYKRYSVEPSVSALVKSLRDVPYWLKSVAEDGLRAPEVDANMLLVPATFLISPDEQKIIKAEYCSNFYDHSTFTEIYEPLIFR